MIKKHRLVISILIIVSIYTFINTLSLPKHRTSTLNNPKVRLLQELEKNKNWRQDGFNFQSNNMAKLPESSTLRNQLAFHFPYEPSKPFEKSIWQTWKVSLSDENFPIKYKSYQREWENLNPGYQHHILADGECHSLISQIYSTVPDVAKAYKLMPKSILKADFFRYLILFARGGVYSDIDTVGIKPIKDWMSSKSKIYDKENTVGLVVGIEADPDRPDWNDWYARRIQFCQWTIQAKKGHPMLKNLIAKITEITLEREENGQLEKVLGKDAGGDIMDWTGPGIWTDAVFQYMNNAAQSPEDLKSGKVEDIITWKIFTGIQSPVVIDDVLVLPITSFSPDVGQMGAKSTNDPYCYAKHMFSGSWKDDKPKHKPKPKKD
ncbi:putative glycosyltransferase Hoc1p [[Candida] jaroonii]|uniref:Glycosyltransferase Hoc1p n=1 Tax=[Candida] jaroonii TaxID=467808 RepID=A0ACA9Y8E5_9ASCO|nr:putative glycosyltransferase Hoc1p [[Candida] jaroonii]